MPMNDGENIADDHPDACECGPCTKMRAREAFRARREERVRGEYAELRDVDPEAYRRCVSAAGAILMNERVALVEVDESARLRIAAAIETALISESLEARRAS